MAETTTGPAAVPGPIDDETYARFGWTRCKCCTAKTLALGEWVFTIHPESTETELLLFLGHRHFIGISTSLEDASRKARKIATQKAGS